MNTDANKEYSVNWKNHMSHVRKAFDHFLNSNELTDVTLHCEGKKIGAHKMLLSACSAYFRDTFKEVPCQHPVIIMYGVEYSVLSDILHFIYRGEVSVDNSKLDTFLKTAQLLQISGLTDDPSERLICDNEQITEELSAHEEGEENYCEATIEASEEAKVGKRVKGNEATDPIREKVQKLGNDTVFMSDVKCEPSKLANFEDPLEDPLLQSDQAGDTKEYFVTGGVQVEEEFKIEIESSATAAFKRYGESVPPKKLIPANTLKSRASQWASFKNFCAARGYTLAESTTTEAISEILADYAVNMRKADGTDYKEGVVKTMWNTIANMLQEMFYNKYNIKFDPFRDIEFKRARDSRDMKRQQLKSCPEKRKIRCTTLDDAERHRMCSLWDEDTPSGLQRKFFHVAAFQLSWSAHEASNCLVHHFREERDDSGAFTGRIEYNPAFGTAARDAGCGSSSSKWLVANVEDPSVCSVRLLRKMLSKRKADYVVRKLFLTPNPGWNKSERSAWFKEVAVSRNQMYLWIKEGAEKIGIDTKRFRIMPYEKTRSQHNNS